MGIKKSFVKTSIFSLFIVLTIILLKVNFPNKIPDNFVKSLKETSKTKDTSYFFIGSSRIQRSINPQIISSYFKNKNVYNSGISGSTLLSNSVVIDFLTKNENPKVIFLELSILKPEVPENIITYSNELEFNIFTIAEKLTRDKPLFKKYHFKLNLANYYFHNKISLKNEIKTILGNNTIENSKKTGFITSNENHSHSTSTFLKYEDLLLEKTNKSKEVKAYNNYIKNLLKIVAQTNSKIIFLLPVTFIKDSEKKITIPAYKSIPDSLKINYSVEFLDSITNSEYLLNANHLNSKGAEKYSNLLCPLLEPFFNK